MKIELWEDPRGFSPVREFIINKLNNSQQKWIGKKIEYYQKYSFQNLLQSKSVKEIEGVKSKFGFSLFELRPVPYRFFFVFVISTETILLLNGFAKKTNRTPTKEIKMALNIAINLKKEFLLK